MLVKIDQQIKLSNYPDASEKFYIFIGEDITTKYLGLNGEFYNRMGNGQGNYFDSYDEAKAHAEGFGHDVNEVWSF